MFLSLRQRRQSSERKEGAYETLFLRGTEIKGEEKRRIKETGRPNGRTRTDGQTNERTSKDGECERDLRKLGGDGFEWMTKRGHASGDAILISENPQDIML